MKMEEQSTSPNDKEILSQTQDPLERRRLQNRLSQRNHRRKIRERIAKLQERVIANELRAAAALNGWDQGYNPSLFPRPHSSPSDNELGFTSRDVSPLIPDQCTSFMPSYPPFSQSWPNDFNTFPQHGYPSDLSQFNGVSEASPISPITSAPAQENLSMSPASSGLGGDIYREIIGTPERFVPDPLSTSAPNQPLYYVATEEALPQIIQVINTMSPQYKVIVLVPPESPVSASMASFPSPTSPYDAGHSGSDHGPAAQQSNLQNLGCLCYPHNIHSGPPAHSASRPWMGGGSYAQMCPLHKTANTVPPRGAFPVRMM
nr:TPA_exp: xanthocillin C [Penicillium expansum]